MDARSLYKKTTKIKQIGTFFFLVTSLKSYQIFTKESLSRLERLRSSLTALAIKGNEKEVRMYYNFMNNKKKLPDILLPPKAAAL